MSKFFWLFLLFFAAVSAQNSTRKFSVSENGKVALDYVLDQNGDIFVPFEDIVLLTSGQALRTRGLRKKTEKCEEKFKKFCKDHAWGKQKIKKEIIEGKKTERIDGTKKLNYVRLGTVLWWLDTELNPLQFEIISHQYDQLQNSVHDGNEDVFAAGGIEDETLEEKTQKCADFIKNLFCSICFFFS